MGYTVLLRWTHPPLLGALPEIVLARVLEQYKLNQPTGSTIQLRTYRGSSSKRVLTTFVYSTQEDTAYLVLDDRRGRGMVTSSTSDIAKTEGATPSSIAQVTGKLEIPPVPPIAPTQSASAPAPIPPTQAETTADAIGGLPKASAQIIAVRPAGNVLPLLQGLLSEYVFTQAKSAKGAKPSGPNSLTALPASALRLTSLTFPATEPPLPPITLVMHTPNHKAGVIFLEAEWSGVSDKQLARPVLREFLAGCLPSGVGGEQRFYEWEGEEVAGGWEGTERQRRTTSLLAQGLRDSGHI